MNLTQEIRFIYTNAEGLASKRNELYTVLDDFLAQVICVTESHYTSSAIDDFDLLQNYTTFRADRQVRSKGGAVLCINNTCNPNLIAATVSPFGNWEAVWCSISLGLLRINIGCCYKSPDILPQSYDLFLQMLQTNLSQAADETILVGDFNYPDIDWNCQAGNGFTNRPTDRFLQIVEDNFLTQLVDFPTRFRNLQQPSLLDLVLVSESIVVDGLKAGPPLGKSDHAVLTWSVVATALSPEKKESRPQFYKADFVLLNSIFSSIDWHDEFNFLTCSEAWEILRDFINNSCECFIPQSAPSQPRNSQPWMSPKIRNERNHKKKKWQTYKLFPTDANWSNYTRARNDLTQCINNAKQSFEEDLARRSKTNKKLLYSYFRGKRRTSNIIRLKSGNTTTSAQDEVADIFNDYFTSVYHPMEDLELPEEQVNHLLPQIDDVIITEDAVFNLLSMCDASKSPGPDNIHAAFLKGCAASVCIPLTIIFIKSIEEGTLPGDWKSATIIPLHKKGDRTLPSNYRPISLTSQVVKTFERLISKQLMAFLEDNKLLSEKQHGFRSGRSCLSNLLETTNKWTSAVDSGTPCDAIFLDICKAFDKVSHNILIKKLHAKGVRGRLLKWITAFLTQRKQRVSCHGSCSPWAVVSSGVPQGTVLGPLFFLVYINDLPDKVKSDCNMLADDTKIFRGVASGEDCIALQNDLHSLSTWADDNRLSFNTSKCEVLHMGRNNGKACYTLGNQPLPSVTEATSLGIVMSSDLKVRKQCVAAAKKANRALGQIKKHFSHLTVSALKSLYITFVRPHLEFSVQAWNPHFAQDQQILETVQHRATRIVPSLRRLPYEDRLRKLGLTTLTARRTRGDLLQVFKILHGYDHADPRNYFTLAPNVGTRGHPLKLQRVCSRLDVKKYAFPARIVADWNRLPAGVVGSQSINAWKNAYDKLTN
jgi:hypothetical protein